MKLFDVDWVSVLRDLPRWSALPLAARRTLLAELRPNGNVPAARFGLHLDAIVTSGIPRVDKGWTRLWVGDERRDLVKVLRATTRHQLFDAPTMPALVRYMEEHFTNSEIELLGRHRHRGGGYIHRHTVAPQVAFEGWTGDLLSATRDEAVVAWAAERSAPVDGRSILIFRDLQDLARRLLEFPDGVPLEELAAPLQGNDLFAFADALYYGLGTLVLFAGMRGSDLVPLIGLWPIAARELTRVVAQPPSAVVPAEQYTLAMQMEDMTALLAAAVTAPVRLRANDLAVFARARAAIEGRLVPLPAWVVPLVGSVQVTRVDGAARELENRRFAEVRQHHDNPHLEPTPAGAAWLALSPHDRLAKLVDPLRRSTAMNPAGAYDSGRITSFFPFTLSYMQPPKSLRLRDALTGAFLGSAEGFIPIEEFLDYATREANPFLAQWSPHGADPYAHIFYNHMGDPRQGYRRIWRTMLLQFLVSRLFSLGGAPIGRLENGALCFALTDVGRYLFGAGESFVYGTRESGGVVVQPNFDVVFLSAAPSLEATIARFAERVGVAPGLTFRLTRASVLGAAEAGVMAEEVIGALSGASSKPLPKNVEREISGWIASVRRARLRNAQLLECADEEAATRVASLLGSKTRRLTATIFELPAANPSARTAMIKKLRTGGVFLEDSTGRGAQKPVRTQVRLVDPEDTEDLWDDVDDV